MNSYVFTDILGEQFTIVKYLYSYFVRFENVALPYVTYTYCGGGSS